MYRFNAISNKLLLCFDLDNLFLKLIQSIKGLQKVKVLLKKNQKEH